MRKLLVAFMSILLLFVLTACGDSTEEDIVGNWQLIEGGKESNYWEVTEDKLTIKSRAGETLQSMKYKITDLQDYEFKFEIIEPLNNNKVVFFEGYFENKDTIKSIRYSLGDFELIRVDDIEKELVDIKDKINVPDSSTDLKREDSKDETTEKVPKITKTSKAAEEGEVSNGRTVSGFDTKTNKTITWSGIDFSFPSYFDVLDKGSTETLMHYYPEEEDYYASIVFQSVEYLGTEEEFYSEISSTLKSILDSRDFANTELQKSEKISIAGLPGWTTTYSESDANGDGVISTGIDSFVYNINTGEVITISLSYDSKDKSQHDYLGDYSKVLKTAKLLIEPLDLNAINSTNSNESDEKFVGKYYRVTGIIDQAMKPSDGLNAMVIIQPDVMAKGMGSTLPLEINIWLTADEFEKIGGISSVGKQIDLSVKLKSISRNVNQKDPAVNGYPIQLEFGEYE